jgi:circadian clock protein KaiC
VITAESGHGKFTRQGIEEYVADCVILLDHRVEEQSSIRRLRVVKYRGTLHGTNEYPFLIGETGLSVLPLSSLKLDHKAPTQRISSGVPRLDTMLGGKGYFRGNSILVSGGAGTGKSTLAAHFVQAACQRGERALYMTSEQSHLEIIRNMRSVGIDLEPWMRRGLLRFYASRTGTFGLEKHLVTIHDLTISFDPKVVVIDPITNFAYAGSFLEVKSMVTRLIDTFKARQITAMFNSLTLGDSSPELTEAGVSSLMDAWLLLRNLECNGERNRGLCVLKSRGMAHSNQIREMVLTSHGVQLLDIYVGSAGLVTGSARIVQEARERAEGLKRIQMRQGKKLEIEQKRQQLESQIAKMRSDFELDEENSSRYAQETELQEEQIAINRVEMGSARDADVASADLNGRA